MKDYNAGHRQRLRRRLLENGLHTLQDYERLELLLTFVRPRQDTKKEAKNLLHTHQSLRNVLFAARNDLTIVSERFQALMQLCLSASLWQDTRLQKVFSSSEDVVAYVMPLMAELLDEHVRCLFVDAQGVLIYEYVIESELRDRVHVDGAKLVRFGLLYKASGLIVVHNHPSGDSTPSHEDHEFTTRLGSACAAVGLILADHLVVSTGGCVSCLH